MQSPDGTTVATPIGVSAGGEIAGPATSRNLLLDDFLHSKRAMGACGVVVLLILFCFVGPLIYRTNQTVTNLRWRTCRRGPAIRSAPTNMASTSSAGSWLAASPRWSWASRSPSRAP